MLYSDCEWNVKTYSSRDGGGADNLISLRLRSEEVCYG